MFGTFSNFVHLRKESVAALEGKENLEKICYKIFHQVTDVGGVSKTFSSSCIISKTLTRVWGGVYKTINSLQ